MDCHFIHLLKMTRLCEEHVTMTSAYQIFEVFYAQDCILLKTYKCGDRQYVVRGANLVTPSLGGRYIIFQNKIPKQIPPWRWGFYSS